MRFGLILVLLGLVATAVMGYSDTYFHADSFTNLNRDKFQLLGARLNPLANSVLLTTLEETYSASAMYYKIPVFLRGFRSNFTFSLDKAGKADSAHGITFVIQNDSEGPLALGGVGAGLGYASSSPDEFKGIENSLVIELDCIGNPEMNDPANVHLSIHTRGTSANSANEHHASVYSFDKMADFCSGSINTAEVIYEPGRLLVSVTPIVSPVADVAIKIEEVLNLQGHGKGYLGFTSSTGSRGANQEVLTWSYAFLGKGNAANSQASGPGLSSSVAGKEASFIIVAYDQYKNLYPFGGSHIAVNLLGPGSTTPLVTDFGNGTYKVDYTLTAAGAYSMQVLFDGAPVGGISQYDVTVVHTDAYGPTTAPTTFVPTTPVASAPSTIQIQAKDRYGNPLTRGADKVEASLSPIDTRDSTTVIDHNNGLYSITYTTFTAQAYDLVVSINGEGISGSPFRLNTQPAEINPSQSIVSNLPDSAIAGETTKFTLVTRDSYGNQLRVGGAVVGVVPTPQDESFEVLVDDRADGQYFVSIYFEKATKYQITVTVNGVGITAGVHPVEILPTDVSLKHCEATGEGLTTGLSGVASFFTIVSKDRFSNPYGGPISFKYIVLVVGSVNISASAVNNDDGTTTVTYTPIVSGAYTTYISGEGTDIKNSPSATSVSPNSPSAQFSSVLVPHYHLVDPHVLKNTWLQVQIRDKYQNKISVGGHNVEATVEPTSDKREPISPQVTDNKNGTYTVSFIPEETQDGEYVLTITLDNKNILGSPFTLYITPTDHTNTIALAVGIPVVVICFVALVGLVWYKKWKKPSSSGYSLVPQDA